MNVTISNEIKIENPTEEVEKYCLSELVIINPQYLKKRRMGLWIGNTPMHLYLYRKDVKSLILPVGTARDISKYLKADDIVRYDFADNGYIAYDGEIGLYDYQEKAVGCLQEAGYGILQSPCGSGKTQMGIALAARLSKKTLWVTHTQDLLEQSYQRAATYYSPTTLGKITRGKVEIGSHITFATVQTLSKLDLTMYKYEWDVVIVDECQRLAGTPSSVTMFYKTLSHLAAKHKYGLSATVHRSDGLIKSTFAMLGDIVYTVPIEAVADKTMQVIINKRDTGIKLVDECLDTDGTLDYQALIRYLASNEKRNKMIVADLYASREQYCLILSDRLEHLETMRNHLRDLLEGDKEIAMIDGRMTSRKGRQERIQALEDMRQGRKRYLFATYALAKEGLDIPRLDRLFLTLPKRDYAVVTQSIGRIARQFPGKATPIVYDYVDDIGFCQRQFIKRRAHYKKAGAVQC